MIKLKAFSGKEERLEKAREIKQALESLPEKIKEIQFYEIGLNIIESERAVDISLISKFNTIDDLEKYIVHPDHQNVVSIIRKYSSNIASVDYEK